MTKKREALLAAGRHPATGRKLRGSETCGTCRSHVAYAFANTYHKCQIAGTSHSAATDIRVRWPACELWQPEENT